MYDSVVCVTMQDQRVPADMILLRTTEKNGSCFVRTDQLDGETDWKLRVAVPSTQTLPSDQVCTYTVTLWQNIHIVHWCLADLCVCVCVCYTRVCLVLEDLCLPRNRRRTSTTSLGGSQW